MLAVEMQSGFSCYIADYMYGLTSLCLTYYTSHKDITTPKRAENLHCTINIIIFFCYCFSPNIDFKC